MLPRRLLRLFYLSAFCLLVFAPIHARAATYTVTTDTDSATDTGSLRYAVNEANADTTPDTIVFASNLTNAIIQVASTLQITNSVTIDDPTQTIAIEGQGTASQFPIFEISGGTSANPITLNGLTIENGDNQSVNGGVGGGVSVDPGEFVVIANCSLFGNLAFEGDGLGNLGTATVSNTSINNAISGYFEAYEGGGIYSANTLVMGGTTAHAVLTLTDCTFSNNNADSIGGGLCNVQGTATLTDCSFNGNTSQNESGGGICDDDGTISLTGCTFTSNSASYEGGGVAELGGTASLTDCTFTNNTATSAGHTEGGGGYYNGGTSTLTDCLFTGNTSEDQGGGLLSFGVSSTLTNCVFTQNIATDQGGAVYYGSSSVNLLFLTNCTITDNTANNISYPNIQGTGAAGGALYDFDGGMATLTNDILYGDTGGEFAGGGSNTASHCDIEATGDATDGIVTNIDNVYADPQFTNPPTNNPPTNLAPLGGSPVVDAGATQAQAPHGVVIPTEDFTGAPQTSPPTIGAYDAATAPTTTMLTSSASPTVYGQPVTFTATVAPVSPATGTPTGTATFTYTPASGTPITDTGVALTNGVATDTPALSAGNYTVTATYNGSNNFTGSASSPALSQNVSQASTVSSLTSSVNPVSVGQPVTYTVTVTPISPGAGTPTGSVQFYLNGSSSYFDSETLVNGQATSTAQTYAQSGGQTISVVYSGDNNFLSNNNASISETVSAAAPTATTTSVTSPAVGAVQGLTFGQNAVVNVTVSPAAAPGTVTVTLTPTIGVSLTQTAVETAAGSGQYTATFTAPDEGSYQVSAQFIPASLTAYTISQEAAGTVTVSPATVSPTPTTATVANGTDTATPTVGQLVDLTVSVAPTSGTGTPTGTVVFTLTPASGGSPIVSPAETLSGGVANYTTSALAAGSYSVTAAYNGDSSHAASVSAPISLTISPATTTPTVLGTIPASLQLVSFTENYAGVSDPWSAPSGEPFDFYTGGATSPYTQSTTLPALGQGAWVFLPSNTQVYDTGTPAPTNAPFSIPLNQGWNIIGDPFNATIPLASCMVSADGATYSLAQGNNDGLEYTTLFSYPGGFGASYTPISLTGSLTPFTGYWMYAFQPCTLLVPPPVTVNLRKGN